VLQRNRESTGRLIVGQLVVRAVGQGLLALSRRQGLFEVACHWLGFTVSLADQKNPQIE
jgi:hypothetical protein